jgi:hypothetical protein
MPLLNGKVVEAEEIDPAKHKFIGMFRKPMSQIQISTCLCGRMFGTSCGIVMSEFIEHYQRGHFDESQYVDIE